MIFNSKEVYSRTKPLQNIEFLALADQFKQISKCKLSNTIQVFVFILRKSKLYVENVEFYLSEFFGCSILEINANIKSFLDI